MNLTSKNHGLYMHSIDDSVEKNDDYRLTNFSLSPEMYKMSKRNYVIKYKAAK